MPGPPRTQDDLTLAQPTSRRSHAETPLTAEPSCKDEARIGQKNGLVRQWARRRSPPPPAPPRRSALRKRLPVRCHLPGARPRRGARHALRRQRGDATPSRRDLEPRPARRPRRAPPRSGRLAYDRSPGRAEKHHPRLPALARPRAQSGREHLAVLAPELALEPRVRNLRSDYRSGL